MSTQPQKKRTRLNPQARKAQILDATALLVLEKGLTSLTMADIAAAADVSKALIYAYFPNMTELLHEVYVRETALLNRQHLDALKAPHRFEDMVRVTARISRQSTGERQKLVSRLATDPLLASRVAKDERRNRASVVRFLANEITGAYDLSPELAAKATRLALRFEPDARLSARAKEELDEIWGAMIVGAMTELERRYGSESAGEKNHD